LSHMNLRGWRIASLLTVLLAALLFGGMPFANASAAALVSTIRVPDGGIQPQVAVDGRGIVHIVYYKGDAAHGDIFYVRSTDGGQTFSAPIRVNSQPGSAIAMGNIRGAQIAVGKNGRVHVAWNGSDVALPRGPGKLYNSPMLYTRLRADGTGFELQRNLMRSTFALDGGGSVAADTIGNVYVAWHGLAPGTDGETERRVWIARSSDDGATFSPEQPAWNQPTGACGCCELRIFAQPRGAVYLLYRSAVRGVERDMYLLGARPSGSFSGKRLSQWHINGCPMSSEAFAVAKNGVLGAWETRGQVYFTRINPATFQPGPSIPAPGAAGDRKHPALAVNSRGQVLMAWTEGTGWGQGGSVAWQLYDPDGHPVAGASGRTNGVPAWSLVAAFARPDGSFTVLY
jgi:hypothetical protein